MKLKYGKVFAFVQVLRPPRTLKMSLWRGLSRLNVHVKNLNINSHCKKLGVNCLMNENINYHGFKGNAIHTSPINQDLMEFFDDQANWSAPEVHVGRSWKLEELRIKSNSDLHKLWYVLLKEKNMLLTMEHEYRRQKESIPNPERLDKVEESMENLETVVRERNQAYFELETGQTGERPKGIKTNCFGIEYMYKMKEFRIEKKFNKPYLENEKIYNQTTDYKYVKNFLVRLEEKKRKLASYNKRKRTYVACKLMEIFPNLDEEALKEKFPDLDIDELKKSKRSRSHQENAY